MFRYIKNEQGSTSVLIILLMIVLMAFGVAALTTAHAGYRLAHRNSEFTVDYYEVEGDAVQIQYDIYQILMNVKYDIEENETVFDYDTYTEMYHEKTEEAINQYIIETEKILQPAFEKDGFAGLVDEPTRIGTFHYTIKAKENNAKNISVVMDLYMSDSDKYSIMEDVIKVISWYEWQEGVGEIEEELFFEDPFEDADFQDQSEDGDNDPFN